MRIQLLGALCALAFMCPTRSAAEPLTLDTLLGLESFGRVSIDPGGRVAVFEERLARADLPRYDLQTEGALRYARLYRVDLDSAPSVRPLIPMEPDAGYTMGPFSPDGRRLAIFRLQGLTWRLGLLDLHDGSLSWTEVSPELPAWGRSVEWVSNTSLVAIGTPNGGLPTRLSRTNLPQMHLPDLWAKAARGEPMFVSSGLGFPAEPLPQQILWRIDATTGGATELSEGAFLDLEVSPDGRHIALVEDGPLLWPPSPQIAAEFRRARRLRIFDIQEGSAVDPREADDISTSLISWSPSGDALLVTTLNADHPRVLVIGAQGDARDRTPEGFTPDVSVDVFGSPTAQGGWLGNQLVIRGGVGTVEGWYVISAEGPVRLEGVSLDARLVAQGVSALLFEDEGRIVRIHRNLRPEVLGEAASIARPEGPFGQRAATSAMKATDAVIKLDGGRICRAWADSGPRQCVVGQPGSAVSWNAQLSLGFGQNERSLNELTLRRQEGSTLLWRLNPELDQIDLATPRRVHGAAGDLGWLYLPQDSQGAPPPVVVVPYQGLVNLTPPRRMRPERIDLTQNAQLLVASGYAVLFPDLPPTEEPAAQLANRILAVVDAAAAEGAIDPDRVGLWGHSFGGWSSVMSATQSGRFKAVVALNGSFNWQSVIADMADASRIMGDNDVGAIGSARWLETGQAAMHQPYWTDPDRYRRNSPFEAAPAITTPILLIHGELDFGPTQSEQMYAALHRLGAPVALTLLFGEDHGIHSPGAARVYYSQVMAWFDRFLRSNGSPTVVSSVAATPQSAPD